MAEESQRPIVIRRNKRAHHGAHGGAWKIAYADFVTAMMAFFLLMWLLGSTSKGDLEGIAEYFKNPMKVSMQGGSGAGDSSSVIKGGGSDLTRRDHQVRKGETAEPRPKASLKAAQAELERQEMARLRTLKTRVEAAIDLHPTLSNFRRQMLIDITDEGLRIQIVDEQNRPMFASGRAELQPYTREILRELAVLLNEVPNKISLSGHTDAAPYAFGEKAYSNWELSADRANASRRELIGGGLGEGKVMRVVGLGPAVMFDRADPLNPVNRRISIIVMNKKTEDTINKEGKTVEIENAAELDRDRIAGGSAPPS